MRLGLVILHVLVVAACQDRVQPQERPMPGSEHPVPVRVIAVATPVHPSHLLVLLHGVGASGDDLVPIGRALAPSLPTTEIISPDGIAPFDGGPGGRQWFSIRGITEDNRTARVQQAANALSAWLDGELAKRSLSGDRLLLLGFSQGAILANSLALSRRPSPGGVVSLSGRLSVPPELSTSGHPRVLVMHGRTDPVIPIENGRDAASGLQARGATVTFQERTDLGHAIDAREIGEASRFLADVVGARAIAP